MNFIKRFSLVFLIAILGLCEAVAATYELAADPVWRPFKRPNVIRRSNPGADSPLVPHSPSTSPVSSSISGEEDDEGALQFVPLKRVRGGGSPDGSAVSAALEQDVLLRAAGIFPRLLVVNVVPVIVSGPKTPVYRSKLNAEQQAEIRARNARFRAVARVPALAPVPVPVVGAPRIVAGEAYKSPDFQKASTFVETATLPAVYNLTGNWKVDKKGNYQISEVGCAVTEFGKEKIATVFFTVSGYGAYVSPAFMTDKKALLGKRVKIMGACSLVEELTSDIAVVISPWDKIALLKTRFDSFGDGQAWVEKSIADLGISLEQKPV